MIIESLEAANLNGLSPEKPYSTSDGTCSSSRFQVFWFLRRPFFKSSRILSKSALALRLNLPAIQAANYAVMPLQVALIVPFVRLGGRLFAFGPRPAFDAQALLHSSPLATISQMGGLAGQAMLAWLVIAIPAVALMTAMLTVLLRRVPVVAAAGSGDRFRDQENPPAPQELPRQG